MLVLNCSFSVNHLKKLYTTTNMYFKHNKFASISPICFRLPEQTLEQPRGDEANLPRHEVPPLPLLRDRHRDLRGRASQPSGGRVHARGRKKGRQIVVNM